MAPFLVPRTGATDIRKNQWQVDINGNVVGSNRPDLQYTLNGKRHYVEFDRNVGTSLPHRNAIVTNDPNGKVITKIIR